jgi:phosphoglycerate dehydrogenase-like enzyme
VTKCILAERVKSPQNPAVSGVSPPTVTTLLVSHHTNARHGARIAAAAGRAAEILVLPPAPDGRLPESDCARANAAFFSGDVVPDFARQFFSTARKAPRLKWLHVFNVGVDHPIFDEMLARGVRLTTSAGSTALPIAQTAIMGMLALARGFPRWLTAQRDRRWDPERGLPPADLRGQTAVVVGLGRIGAEIARLARALGLKVAGIRRGPRGDSDPVDELHPPAALAGLLPRCDWLILACPLTPETRGLIDAAALARLPRGARLINIARGEIVDEPALTEALRGGRLAGAYLDVFETEPLPPESALWNLPNVLVTPHNSAAAAGNEERVLEIFLDNLGRWQRGAPLVNEVPKNAPA